MNKVILIIVLTSPVFALQADLNNDANVNFEDFAIFARDWAKTSGLTDPNTDLNADGTVDYKDLYIFAEQWSSIAGQGNHAPDLYLIGDKFVYENSLLTFTVNATDFDNNDLTYSCTYEGNTSPAGWSFANQIFSWTPDFNQSGIYSFRFDVNDGSLTDSETIVITVYDFARPDANSENLTAYTYITKTITLTATDDGLPNPPGRLTYIITTEPNDANCYIQDPASGCGKITANLLPYTLRNHGSTVWLAADNNENFSFTFKVNDGLYDSDIATIDVNVLPNPQDCLSFDGGWVTIPDNNNLDLEPNRAIGFCFKTRKPFCNLIRKHEAGKTGYDVNLVSGRIVANVYDANGIVATIKSGLRYDNGKWANIVIAYNGVLELYTGFGDLFPDDNWYPNGEALREADAVAVPAGIYSNDCNLVIGDTLACFTNRSGEGEIDGIRTYTFSPTDDFRCLFAVQSRETAGDAEVLAIPQQPIVRFKCNEGSGNTITNDKDPNLVGVFSDPNKVKWTPWNWYWADINVLRGRNR